MDADRALLSFDEVAASPGPLAVTDAHARYTPGETFLTGRHGGAYIDAHWLALSATTRIAFEHRSVRVGSEVRGHIELADGRCVSLASVRAAEAAA